MRLERLRPKYAGVRMRQVRAGRPLTCVPDEIPHLWAAAAVALASAPRERALHDACVACLSTRSFRHVTAARSNAMPSSTRVDSFRCIRVHPTMAPMWLRCGWVRASHHQPHGLALEQGSKGPHVHQGPLRAPRWPNSATIGRFNCLALLSWAGGAGCAAHRAAVALLVALRAGFARQLGFSSGCPRTDGVTVGPWAAALCLNSLSKISQ